jgi:hypothetical protein
MNMNFAHIRPALVLVAALLSGAAANLRAVLPEPSNMIYGFITISNQVVGADRSDLMIEARRSSNGVAVASYRIGDNEAYGNAYFLEIPLEAGTPSRNLNATTNGTALFIALKDDSGDLALLHYTVTERGRFQRLDIVIGAASDVNGLPDPWEIAHFGAAGQDPNADPDGDGRNNLQEFLAGTNPNVADGVKLEVLRNGAQVLVTVFARKAEGPGYEGRARYYSLETTTNVNMAAWQPVANFTNLFGNNQTIIYTVPAGGPRHPAFRTKINLQ